MFNVKYIDPGIEEAGLLYFAGYRPTAEVVYSSFENDTTVKPFAVFRGANVDDTVANADIIQYVQ